MNKSKKWYKRQKQTVGVVYLLRCDSGATYIGATTNSLQKRLEQQWVLSKVRDSSKLCQEMRLFSDRDQWQIETIYTCKEGDNLAEKEQYFINLFAPSLNMISSPGVHRNNFVKGCYKGGVNYQERWWPTKKALWEEKGKVLYNTFKTRLFRGFSIKGALGDE